MPSIEYWVEEYKRRLIEVERKACAGLARRIVYRTPVDIGTLRFSWTPSIGMPDYSNSGGDFFAVAHSLQPGDTFCLANGQPYVRVIEYNGHSNQAPHGMMRISIAEWGQILRGAVGGV